MTFPTDPGHARLGSANYSISSDSLPPVASPTAPGGQMPPALAQQLNSALGRSLLQEPASGEQGASTVAARLDSVLGVGGGHRHCNTRPTRASVLHSAWKLRRLLLPSQFLFSKAMAAPPLLCPVPPPLFPSTPLTNWGSDIASVPLHPAAAEALPLQTHWHPTCSLSDESRCTLSPLN